jgi:hypothetical protein
MQQYDNRRYVIIPASAVSKVDFSQVLETSAETCRYSVDESKTFVKYEGEMPLSIVSIEGKSEEYSHDEILTILSGEEWTAPMDKQEEGMG